MFCDVLASSANAPVAGQLVALHQDAFGPTDDIPALHRAQEVGVDSGLGAGDGGLDGEHTDKFDHAAVELAVGYQQQRLTGGVAGVAGVEPDCQDGGYADAERFGRVLGRPLITGQIIEHDTQVRALPRLSLTAIARNRNVTPDCHDVFWLNRLVTQSP